MYKPKDSIWDIASGDDYEEVTKFIQRKTDKLEKIEKNLESIKSLFEEYIKLTKDYCEKIAMLALQLKPEANSNEGKLTQAIQGILLFNSVSLETLAKEMDKNIKIKSKGKNNHDIGVSSLNEFSQLYQTSYAKLINDYCCYILEMENYEKYLMNKEMGLNNYDYSNIKAKEDKDNEEKNNSQHKKSDDIKIKNNKNNIHKEETVPHKKLDNNLTDVLESKRKYLEQIGHMNNLINKLSEYGLNEEKTLNEEFHNILDMFVIKLNECLEGQRKKYEGQSVILAELKGKIMSEESEKIKCEIQEYKLHCLSIYINMKNLLRNKKGNLLNINGKDEVLVKNQKSKEYEIYKNITLENIENIIKEMKSDGLEITEKDLNDLEKEKVKDFIEKKCKLISSKTENISEEDKNKLIKYVTEDEEYRSFFLQILNNDRAKGGEILNKNIFTIFSEIFRSINDLILEKNDQRFFQYVSIISMTYFINEGNDNKIYLYEYIKDNEKLKNLEFWKKYLDYIAENDLKNDLSKEELKNEKNAKIKLQFSAFSNTLTIINNMVNFGFDRKFIDEFLDFSEKKYSLTKEQIDQIQGLIVVWMSNLDISKANKKETNTGETDPICDDDFEDMK